MIDVDEIAYEVLSNIKKGSNNHLISDCPFCLKTQHFYIRRKTSLLDRHGKNKSGHWDCKKCGKNGTLFSLLIKLGRRDLSGGIPLQLNQKISIQQFFNETEQEAIDIEAKPQKLPAGFRTIKKHPYLDSRGFTDLNYKFLRCGSTSLITKFKNYIIFPVFQNGSVKGFVARVALKNDEIKRIERETGYGVLRYKNSKKSEHHKLLYGYDEIVAGLTKTVILVEGIFDKKTVDNRLGLYSSFNMKCCSKQGKNISIEQVSSLLNKGVEKIILVEDSDALADTKRNALFLDKFFQVEVGYLKHGDIDEIDEKGFLEVFSTLHSPLNFTNKIRLLGA